MFAARKGSPGAGLTALTTAAVLWGTGGPLGDLLARTAGLPAFAVAGYRLLIGGAAILLVLAVRRRRLPRDARQWRRVVVIALLAALFQGSYFVAITLTSVSLATLITIGATPAIVLGVEILTGRCTDSGRALGVLAVALAGLALLVGVPPLDITGLPLGAAAAVLSAAGFAATTLLGARPVPGLDNAAMTGAAFTVGGALLAPVAAVTGGLTFHPTAAAVGLLAALGIAPTATAYLLYFAALRTTTATTAAMLSLLEPLTAAVIAVTVLHEHLTAVEAAGAALLAVAVLLAARRGS